MPNPTAGTVLGPYTVEGFLGAGSMGDVFRGIDGSLGRKVAIKLLADKHRDSTELRARFVREGRAVAMVSHPNVVQVFTTGTFDARPYIAMEFLDGTDLGTMVEQRGPMTSLEAAQATLDAAAGLAAASAAGLIHRDVKPSNLVKLTTGSVKVTDFGLAKPVDPGTEPALTALGVVVGTPDYIAPEQARGEPIDERVDIYALGGTLYFLLTGRPPFRTGVAAEDKYLKVVARHLRQPPPDAREKNPAADAELAELARSMMAKKATERPRYPDLDDRLAQIAARLAGGGTASRSRPRAASRQVPMAASEPAAAPAASDRASRDRSAQRVAEPPGSASASAFDSGATIGESSVSLGTPRVFTRPLVALTAIATLVLVVGAIVYLTAGRSAGASQAAPGSGSARVGSGSAGSGQLGSGSAIVVTPPPAPVAPAGMVLVRDAAGQPAVFVDVQPVTGAEFAAMFASHKVAKGGASKAAIGVTYVGARSYAQTKGGRLLTSAEFDAAMATPGVVPTPTGLFEWIDSSGAPDAGPLTVRAPGKAEPRKPQGPKDVTFRRARSLPATPAGL